MEYQEVDEAMADSLQGELGGLQLRTKASFIQELELLDGDDLRVTERECGICFDEFDQNSHVNSLPCKHFYHKACIVQWLEINNKCPKCRGELPSEELPRNNPLQAFIDQVQNNRINQNDRERSQREGGNSNSNNRSSGSG